MEELLLEDVNEYPRGQRRQVVFEDESEFDLEALELLYYLDLELSYDCGDVTWFEV